jgi:hypothetical protein
MMLRESTSASPTATSPGLALTATRDAAGQLWLHGLLVAEPGLDAIEWARRIAGLVLQLAWLPNAAPRLCPIAAGLPFATELAEREESSFAFNLCFTEAFAVPIPAPHFPCFVTLGSCGLAPVTLTLDPSRFEQLPELESCLRLTPTDALLRTELEPARTDLETRLHELERALQEPRLRERTVDAPLLEAIMVAAALADAGSDSASRRAQAIAWAHEQLDRLDAHRHALAVRLRNATGSTAGLIKARMHLHTQTWRALTGDDSRLAGLFADAQGRSLLARRPPS